jgi:hypothetical protein
MDNLEIQCHCRRCGRPFKKYHSKFNREQLQVIVAALKLPINNWDDYIVWQKRNALCQKCIWWMAHPYGECKDPDCAPDPEAEERNA